MVATSEASPVVIRGPLVDRIYRPIIEKRWEDIPEELCFWGGAGTGKSFGLMTILVLLMTNEEIGGLRILWCRKTRKSITNSSIVTYRKVLESLGMRMSSKPGPGQRQSEKFETPAGMNEMVWMTLEDPESAFSAEYDIVVFEEAIQTSEATYETASGRCLRNEAIPAQFVVSLTNPGSRFGWIYNRMFGRKPRMVSCKTTIRDNPHFWDIEKEDYTDAGRKYIRKLEHIYTGTRLTRLLHGEWVSEEGWIFEGLFEESLHMYRGGFVRRPGKRPVVAVKGEHPCLESQVALKWTFGSLDHGFVNAGTLLVWGVDDHGRLIQLDEVYHSDRDRDWWAEQILDMTERYDMECVVTDHDPERRIMWNKVITERLPHKQETVDGEPYIRNCSKSNGSKDALKVDVVRTLLQDGADGLPRCYLKQGARRHAPDPKLASNNSPASLEEEIPQLVWKEQTASQVDAKQPEEKIAEARSNHAFDAWVYAGRFLALAEADTHDWGRKSKGFAPGSFEAHWEATKDSLEEDDEFYG